MIQSSIDDFDILSRLGAGSYGVVFKVRRRTDQKCYVIKTVRIVDLSLKEQQSAINEVTILSQLESPFVVHYFDSFISGESLHLVMEYCNKGDLQGLIKKAKEMEKGGLPEDLTWDMGLQILLGLHYLHGKKVLHRDLKTANIFLMKDRNRKSPSFKVKIGDLGVAKLLETSTAFAQTVVGTPYYLSPELCSDQPYGDKSDCWALGILLYECCTLKHPFEARNQCALIMKIIQSPVQALTSEIVSKELNDLILWLLIKDPKKRPNTKDIMNEKLMRDKMEESGYDIPIDLIDCITTNYLSKKSPPSSPKESAANSLGNERKMSQSDQRCNRLPPPPPRLSGKVIEIGEKGGSSSEDMCPSSSKWGPRNGKNGDLSTSNIGRGIVGIVRIGKGDAIIGRERVRERESNSGSNINRGRIGVRSGAGSVAGTVTGTEGCVRGDRVRGPLKVQSDKARLRHQVKAPVVTIPLSNDGIGASSSSSSSSSSKTKNTYNDDGYDRNDIDRSDRRQSESKSSRNIIESEDDFVDDSYSLSISTTGYDDDDDDEYRCDSNECSNDLINLSNGTPIAIRYRIREGNRKGNDSNLSTVVTQIGSGRYAVIKLGSTVKNMNDVNNRSMSTDHSTSNQKDNQNLKGLITGDGSNFDYSQYDDDDFEGSDGLDDEVEEAKNREDDTYSDCDSDFRDCPVDDIQSSINDANEDRVSRDRSRGSPDSHCLSSNGIGTQFGEKDHTLRRSLSLATALTKDAVLASSLHKEKEKKRGERRERNNYSKDSSDDTADELWNNVWGTDSDGDSSSIGGADDDNNFDSSGCRQTNKRWQTSYIPQEEKRESDSDEDGGHYSYTDFEEHSSETIQTLERTIIESRRIAISILGDELFSDVYDLCVIGMYSPIGKIQTVKKDAEEQHQQKLYNQLQEIGIAAFELLSGIKTLIAKESSLNSIKERLKFFRSKHK